MSLTGALNIAQSALATQQAAIQVTGNNIANASNPDYSRQTATESAVQGQQIQPGIFMGDGVTLTSVQRQVDLALNERLRGSISDSQGATTTNDYLSRVQSAFNELGSDDLSTQLSTFFNSWSNLANTPQDSGLRQAVLQSGGDVASEFQTIQSQLSSVASDADTDLQAQIKNANSLAQQVATLNGQIVTAEGGTAGTANSLLDQRDAVLKQLAGLMNIQTVGGDSGMMNVYVGSEPLVVGTNNRGVAMQRTDTNGQLSDSVVFQDNNGTASVTSGEIGALQQVGSTVNGVMSQVDSLANNLIFELNKVHASGQGLTGITSATASNAVEDPTQPLNTANNGLTNLPTNGSFVLHVTQQSTGLDTSTLVPINLSGQGTQTTLSGLATTLSAIPGVSASIAGGKLTIAATSSDVQLSFSQDSSGTLAALGINSFFTGTDASNIAVNPALTANPDLIAAAKNGDATDNQTATAIANLATQSMAGLNGSTLNDSYDATVESVANAAAAATTDASAATTVQNTLVAQQQALSGVSMNEEAINLVQQQQAFIGASRLVTMVNEMMQNVLAMVQ